MANELKMAQIQTITNLSKRGWSKRSIARELGVHRDTVTRHLEGEGDSKCTIVRTGKSGRKSLCEPFRKQIEYGFEVGLSAQRIYQDLCLENGFKGSYDSVQRFVGKIKDESPQRVWRMECEPGEEAQVDFGTKYVLLNESARKCKASILRVVLSHSRKGYSEAMQRENAESFIRGLENAFRAFGGVPGGLIVDNLKAAVKQADWYDPELNPKIEAFCRHYGTLIMPTRPRTPQHKGKIERGIGYVKDNALEDKCFGGLGPLNEYLSWWEQQVADQRIHGTTKKQVKLVFEQIEKPALRPLPESLFPCFEEGHRRVHRDSYVEVKRAYYEVPAEYIGSQVWARWDARMVRVFNHRQEQIAVHVRLDPGQFSHVLHAGGRPCSVERSLNYWRQRVTRLGEDCSDWIDGVLAHRPERAIRLMQGLVSLNRRHAKGALNEACQTAAKQGQYHLREVRTLLNNPTRQRFIGFLEEHEIIRPLKTYDQLIET